MKMMVMIVNIPSCARSPVIYVDTCSHYNVIGRPKIETMAVTGSLCQQSSSPFAWSKFRVELVFLGYFVIHPISGCDRK